MQQYELVSSLSGSAGLDPSLFAPPSCHAAVAKKLTEQSGGTFSRATTPEEEEDDTDAAVCTTGPALALGAAVIGSLMLTMW